jgi:hypothetical protein
VLAQAKVNRDAMGKSYYGSAPSVLIATQVTLRFVSGLRQRLIAQRLTDPEFRPALDSLKQEFEVLKGEIVPPSC